MRVRGHSCSFVFMALGIALATPLRAETLLEVYKLALQNDPKLASARLEHEATTQTRLGALSGILPTVSADYERTRERQNILSSQNTVIGAGVSEFPIEVWALTITQPIFKPAVWFRIEQSEAAMRQAQAQSVAALQGLITRVASAYLGVLAARD